MPHLALQKGWRPRRPAAVCQLRRGGQHLLLLPPALLLAGVPHPLVLLLLLVLLEPLLVVLQSPSPVPPVALMLVLQQLPGLQHPLWPAEVPPAVLLHPQPRLRMHKRAWAQEPASLTCILLHCCKDVNRKSYAMQRDACKQAECSWGPVPSRLWPRPCRSIVGCTSCTP